MRWKVRPRAAATLFGCLVLVACSGEQPAPLPVSALPTVTETVTVAPLSTPSASPTPVPQGWADTVHEVRDGVVFIEVTSCVSEDVFGSGSLVANDLVLTAAHLVNDAESISVRIGNEVAHAEVVSYDPSAEIALLSTTTLLDGHVFTLADSDPVEGTPVAALGYPIDSTFSVTEGIVSATGVSGVLNGFAVPHQIRTSAAINLGNSGGPLVLQDGTQVDVVSSYDLQDKTQRAEGRSNSVSALVAAEAIRSLGTDPQPVELPDCAFLGEWEPTPVSLTVTTDDPRADVLGALLVEHGQAINEGNYEAAYAMLDPMMVARLGTLEQWSSGVQSSIWDSLTVRAVGGSPEATTITVTLRTEQAAEDGFDGQTCSVFDLTYTLVPANAAITKWLIDGVHAAANPQAC